MSDTSSEIAERQAYLEKRIADLLAETKTKRFVTMHASNKVTLENVKNVVRYHKPMGDQAARHERLSVATEAFITALLQNTPDCADRSSAIRHARLAKMEGSAAIALEVAPEA